jgi:hypothetical protein
MIGRIQVAALLLTTFGMVGLTGCAGYRQRHHHDHHPPPPPMHHDHDYDH